MKADILLCLSKEIGHLLLRQPNSFILKFDINLRFSILGFIYDYLAQFIYFKAVINCISNLKKRQFRTSMITNNKTLIQNQITKSSI